MAWKWTASSGRLCRPIAGRLARGGLGRGRPTRGGALAMASAACLLLSTLSGCSTLSSMQLSTVMPTRLPSVLPTKSPAAQPELAPPQLSAKELDLALSLETARLAEAKGMDTEAIDSYTRARRIDPQVSGIAHSLAVLYDRAGRADAAEREYVQAVKETPRSADLLCDYGYFLHTHGRPGEAETQLRQALSLQPGHRQAQVNLALVLGTRGAFDESLRLFTEALGPAAAHHNVGMLRLKAGDRPGAIRDLSLAAARDPSLQETRAVLQSLQGTQLAAGSAPLP
jgi:Tfp pilus assembly protein PilF